MSHISRVFDSVFIFLERTLRQLDKTVNRTEGFVDLKKKFQVNKI